MLVERVRSEVRAAREAIVAAIEGRNIPTVGGVGRLSRLRPLRLGLLAFGTLGLGGCTALTFASGENCETNADCLALGAGFENSICSPEAQICVDASDLGCTASSECIASLGTETARCVDRACVNLVSPDCSSVEPVTAVADDDAIIIGWMGALEGDFASIGVPIQQATRLAVEEFNDRASGGLPGGAGGARRPLVLLSCHDLADESGLRAARHLVDTVKVPAIVGPLFSSISLNVIGDVTIPAEVLTISPSATSPTFTDFPDDGLHWRTVPSDALQAVPLAALVSQVEDRLRADMTLMAGEDLRVVTVSNGGAYGQGLRDGLNDQVAFNGKSAAENLTDGNYTLLSYDDPAENSDVDLSGVVNEILRLEPPPHLVVALGTNEIIDREGDQEGIVSLLESQWASLPGTPPRPYYLFPDGGKVDELLALGEADTSTPPLAARVRGTAGSGAIDNPRFEAFTLRYQSRFNASPGIYSENAYDALYLLAYGILAAGEGALTGPFIASGLERMSDGPRVDTGPNNINATANALVGGGSIDYQGASGPLDFNNETGEAPSNIEVWCLGRNNQNEVVFDSSAQFYEAATDRVVGVDDCTTM
ncbi:MAG: ABC transporter substrate-binding protein [Myxococcota bacterium]